MEETLKMEKDRGEEKATCHRNCELRAVLYYWFKHLIFGYLIAWDSSCKFLWPLGSLIATGSWDGIRGEVKNSTSLNLPKSTLKLLLIDHNPVASHHSVRCL